MCVCVFSNKEPIKRPVVYQNENFGDDSSFWIDWKSKTDLENREKNNPDIVLLKEDAHTKD